SKNFVLAACCQRVRMNIHHHSFCVNRFFIFFQKFFTFFSGFFFRGFSPVPGTFLEGRQAPFRHGRPRGISPPRGRGAGSAKTGGAWPPDDDARDWSGAQRAAAAMPRVEDLPAAGTDCHAERGASLPRRLAPAWAARHGAGRRNRAKPGARGVAPYIEKFLIISNGVFLDYLTQLNYN
ncbi:MAG: hypothetical protein IJJ71_04320, partial [Treponema sp.]|uniref:hypothetical protein n=1 Tax=Treponema sp. TaxID=166 RepID=UPI0025DB0827